MADLQYGVRLLDSSVCANWTLCVCYCFCEGISGDDFFALGVRNGRIVHKYNLGSGLATIISERLNPRIKIHTVNFGRYLKNGWLKVCFIL